jgi:protein CMS1
MPTMLMWLCLQACQIAKLFAKHIKVAEQQQYLQQHPLCIAAGTPNRLCKLADTEALQLSQLQLVVLDVQQDAKQRYVYLFNCNSITMRQ